MKINCKFKAQVLALNTNKKEEKTYYSAVLFLMDSENPEAGTLNVPEEVAKKLVPGNEFLFSGCYNDKYNSFYITGVENGKR